MEKKIALVIGATGLTGRHLVAKLLAQPRFERVRLLVRRPPELTHPRLEVRGVNFDDVPARAFEEVTDVFSCLGTTMAVAGSKEAFRHVDFDIPLGVARSAAEHGASTLVLLSSVGASPDSRNFYLRVKGELEAAVATEPFASVTILRPSLLLGNRHEHRPGEAFAARLVPLLAPLLAGSLRRYRPIEASTVAGAMAGAALAAKPGVSSIEYDRILELHEYAESLSTEQVDSGFWTF